MNEKLQQCCDMFARVITESLDDAIRDGQEIGNVVHSPIYLHVLEIKEPEEESDRFSPLVFDETAFGMQEDSMPPKMLLELFKLTSTKARQGQGVFDARRSKDGMPAGADEFAFYGAAVNAGGRQRMINTETGDTTDSDVVMVSFETVDKDAVFMSWNLLTDENQKLIGYEANQVAHSAVTKEHSGSSQNLLGWPEDELAEPSYPVEQVN